MWRLQKIMARAGLASRRKSEDFIHRKLPAEVRLRPGPSHVNGGPGGRERRAGPGRCPSAPGADRILHREQAARQVLSAVSDPRGRPVVTKLVPSRVRLVPAGRLDFQSEGLMLLTNDGDLVRTITRAGTLEKVYHVKVARCPSPAALRRLQRGIRSGGKRMAVRRIRLLQNLK